jgi:hypothetical protein
MRFNPDGHGIEVDVLEDLGPLYPDGRHSLAVRIYYPYAEPEDSTRPEDSLDPMTEADEEYFSVPGNSWRPPGPGPDLYGELRREPRPILARRWSPRAFGRTRIPRVAGRRARGG